MSPAEIADEAALNHISGNLYGTGSGSSGSSSAPHVAPVAGDLKAQALLGVWLDAIYLSMHALQYHERAQGIDIGRDMTMSLIVVDGEKPGDGSKMSVLVNWYAQSSRLGWRIRQDDDNRPIYLVKQGKSRDHASFVGAEIILPSVGIKLYKLPGPSPSQFTSAKDRAKPIRNDRTPLPDAVVRVQQMWRQGLIQIHGTRGTASSVAHRCIGCEGDGATLCSMCLLPWHRVCATRVAAGTTDTILGIPRVRGDAVPELWRPRIRTQLCLSWLMMRPCY